MRVKNDEKNPLLLTIGSAALLAFAVLLFKGPDMPYSNVATATLAITSKPFIDQTTVTYETRVVATSTRTLVRWDTRVPANALVFYQASSTSSPRLSMEHCDATYSDIHHCVALPNAHLDTAFVFFVQSCVYKPTFNCDSVRYFPKAGLLPRVVAAASTTPSMPVPPVTGGGGTVISGLAVKNISVQAGSSLEHVVEGDTVSFTATVTLTDGSVRAGNGIVTWKVVGDIGSITTNGTFTAGLGSAVSELGQAPGAVAAAYDVRGIQIVGSSEIFNVYAPAPIEDPNLQG